MRYELLWCVCRRKKKRRLLRWSLGRPKPKGHATRPAESRRLALSLFLALLAASSPEPLVPAPFYVFRQRFVGLPLEGRELAPEGQGCFTALHATDSFPIYLHPNSEVAAAVNEVLVQEACEARRLRCGRRQPAFRLPAATCRQCAACCAACRARWSACAGGIRMSACSCGVSSHCRLQSQCLKQR